MNGNDDLDCGLDGDENVPVTVSRLNRLMRRVRVTHIDRIYSMDAKLTKHIHDDDLMQAKILGGLTAIKWMMVIIPFLATALIVSVVLILNRINVL